MKIASLTALEILDSRSHPTVKALLQLESGEWGAASVPSGTSTGAAEAVELRDGDPSRYRGLGCRKAVENIESEIASALVGKSFGSVLEVEEMMRTLDGTENKSRLGANAMLAVAFAFQRAAIDVKGVPLYEGLAELTGASPRLPRLTINLFSGGKHAGGQVEIQDVLVVPMSPTTVADSLAMTFDVYRSAAELAMKKYSSRPLSATEGGLAPPFPSVEVMIEDAVEAISSAGLEPGRDVALALDIASSHFYEEGSYAIGGGKTSDQMVQQLADWADRFPIVSIEDGLAEDDWDAWPHLNSELGDRALILGDDLLCTNPARIRRAIDSKAANALLLKVNQVGSISEAAEALALARDAGWSVTVSARSGETEDDWLADLAVGWAGDQLKVGSIKQSERLSKYNKLLEIEKDTGLPMAPWPVAMRT